MSFSNLSRLGWKACFQQQLDTAGAEGLPARISAVHKGHFQVLTEAGELTIHSALLQGLPPCTVGDWLLLQHETRRPLRLLERFSLLRRKAARARVDTQLLAANVDLLLILSSCNRDFNPARLERYLALALDAGVHPLVVLTKADLVDDAADFRRQAEKLRPGLAVETVNALNPESLHGLMAWCRPGQTLALVGSSGVGKSTLAQSLGTGERETAPIREDDSRGRHTTTARSLHLLPGGALLIDTPGLRELQLTGGEEAIDTLFEDIHAIAGCRFADCRHENEPGCAVRRAIEEGQLEQRRLNSYHKLLREQRHNSETLAERHERFRKQGRLYTRIQRENRKSRQRE